jgi:hypothetical protein
MSQLSHSDFLAKLKHEAESQAKLEKTRFLPPELDSVTSFIGSHPWQVLLVASGLTSLSLEIMKYLI